MAVCGGGDSDGHAADAAAERGEKVGGEAEGADKGSADGDRHDATQQGEGGEAVAHEPKLQPGAEIYGVGVEVGWEKAGVRHLDPPALAGDALRKGIVLWHGPAGCGGPLAGQVKRVAATSLRQDRRHDGKPARAAVAGQDRAVDMKRPVGPGQGADRGA